MRMEKIIGINYGEAIISAEAYGKVCKCTIKVVRICRLKNGLYNRIQKQ